MLSVQDLHVYYGRIHALKGISLQVSAGEIVALIGSNGAGKTTTLTTLSGLLRPREGRILFEGHDLTHLPAHQIVRLGVVHCPEGRQVFARLSVIENLRLAAAHRADRDGVARDLERVYALFPILAERRGQYAGTLSGGEQQMLAIGRALMSRPRLLLLDEPSLGLAPMVVETIFRVIEALRRDGVTILLVEQNAYQALRLADRAYVMETGYIKASGPARALADDPAVKAAYLGG
ncbi:MAG: ABC transporter ATP-binding protein [Candidatus Roseilinea sp.]|jgi:branched-chain amino acid transport system ATP-binding protein|uniref:ABC transporter ATP-binding protein n=1 Tax=Candidatus Thermofonsia Clade 3 bacterium TaxID=2364212 RepID=A0A2M8QB04_9CHLR|nr:ABC transporter ATP-binding protein [Candidatus Roseilinea sp. NK_OTU-006]PJF46982.1 MAG: ABC transporter ATP-binding protein [Candidatus Thermofonsia Clade 3 bacterium]RMG65707.1 MAG: ABC transporter ATP-binding protein [Chloroflexota bacterium]BCX05844.1 MAG: ABC transporter ATP-binding protein [Candidatus Roseilinea sp.]